MGQCGGPGIKKIREGDVHPDGIRAHQQLSTMWVIKVHEVMRMRGPAPCHEDLQLAGKLVPHDPSYLTIFVSHQWLALDHPDASGAQLAVLQDALANIIEGITKVEVDLQAQFSGIHKTLSSEEREALKDGYIWMDWFSVPQERNNRMPGSVASSGSPLASTSPLNLSTFSERSGTESWTSLDEANRCIQSIPAYVEACQIFVSLVPSLRHSNGEMVNYSTWLQRGWCRAEMWCKLLSDKSDVPIVVVTDSDRAEFDHPMMWMRSPVHLGDFGIEQDRRKVCRFIQKALSLKLQRLREKGRKKDLCLYRFFMARADEICGKSICHDTMEEFLRKYMFSSIADAVGHCKGMTGLACATLSGQTPMMQELLDSGASTKLSLPAMREVDIFPGQSLLHLAAQGGERCEEALELLLTKGMDCNDVQGAGSGPPLASCLTGRAVDLMVKFRADVNRHNSVVRASALDGCCYRQVPPSVVQRLIEHRAHVSNEQGVCISPLCMLVFHAHGNPLWKESADLLLEAKANPNTKMKMDGALKAARMMCRCWMAVTKEQPMIAKIVGNGDTTPLGLAAIMGAETMVEYLLAKGAQVHVKNSRQKTILHLASTNQIQEQLRKHVFEMRDIAGRGVFDSEAERVNLSERSQISDPSPHAGIRYHDGGIMSMII